MKTTDSGIFEKKDFGFRCFFLTTMSPEESAGGRFGRYMEETGDRFVKLISIDTITAYW